MPPPLPPRSMEDERVRSPPTPSRQFPPTQEQSLSLRTGSAVSMPVASSTEMTQPILRSSSAAQPTFVRTGSSFSRSAPSFDAAAASKQNGYYKFLAAPPSPTQGPPSWRDTYEAGEVLSAHQPRFSASLPAMRIETAHDPESPKPPPRTPPRTPTTAETPFSRVQSSADTMTRSERVRRIADTLTRSQSIAQTAKEIEKAQIINEETKIEKARRIVEDTESAHSDTDAEDANNAEDEDHHEKLQAKIDAMKKRLAFKMSHKNGEHRSFQVCSWRNILHR